METNKGVIMYIVYGASFCKWCTNVKDFLINREIEFKYVDIQEDKEAWDKVNSVHNFKTIPQVFKGDAYVGGFNELQQSIMADEIANEKQD